MGDNIYDSIILLDQIETIMTIKNSSIISLSIPTLVLFTKFSRSYFVVMAAKGLGSKNLGGQLPSISSTIDAAIGRKIG